MEKLSLFLKSENIFSNSFVTAMDRFASEPDNATKVAKAKWSNLRVHFKVSFKFFDRELRFTRDPRKLFVVVVDCAIYSNCDVFRYLLALGKSRHVWAM